jgi:hypothetical protein
MAAWVAVRFVVATNYFLASAPAEARAKIDARIHSLKFDQPATTTCIVFFPRLISDLRRER